MEKQNRIFLLIVFGILLVLPLISGSSDFKCYSKVEYNSEIIQINPARQQIDQVGIIDYFEPQPADSKYQNVKVYFTTKDLRDNQAVNFSVVCAGENQTFTFEREITPQYKDLNTNVIDSGIWLGDNIGFLIFGLFLILFVAFIIFAIFKGVSQ